MVEHGKFSRLPHYFELRPRPANGIFRAWSRGVGRLLNAVIMGLRRRLDATV